MKLFKKFNGRMTGGNKREDYSQSLKFAYISALSIIALFTYIGHSITNYISDTQLARAEVAYQLRSQSTLVLEISSYANSYFESSLKYDYIFLNQSIDKLQKSYRETTSYIDNPPKFEMGNARKTLSRYYYDDNFSIASKLEQYIKSARLFSGFSDTSTSPERINVLGQLSNGRDRLLIEFLNDAQADFQKETISEIQSIMNIQLYLSRGILFIIILEALFIFRPIIKKLDEYHVKIISQAHEDLLTGLNNRRAFYKQVDDFFNYTKREKKPFAVLLCDLDKFKLVNDTYGHEVGDEVLKHFAKVLKNTLRPFDLIARLGGEEFAIILGNTTPKTAERILNRLLSVIRDSSCQYTLGDGSQGSLQYTTSIGYVVGHPAKILPLDTYLRYADTALYEAKEGGRNRYVRYTPPKKPREPSGSSGSATPQGEV